MRSGMVDKNEPLRDLLTRGGKKNGKFAAYDKFFFLFYSLKKKKMPLHLHWREKKGGACKEHEPDGIDYSRTHPNASEI